MNDYQILHNAPEGATHFDGKTYFRFEMFEHGQAYLVLKNGVWDRGLPAYPVYSCRCLNDIRRLIWFYDQFDRPREAAEEAWNYQQERIDELEQWVSAIADDHPQIPDWIQQSARSLLAQDQE